MTDAERESLLALLVRELAEQRERALDDGATPEELARRYDERLRRLTP